jgi:hypothetical protein
VGRTHDATRNQEFSIGTAPSDYTFGGILGTQEINTRFSIEWVPESRSQVQIRITVGALWEPLLREWVVVDGLLLFRQEKVGAGRLF